MIGNKLSLVKSVLILIILFSFGTVLGVIAYSATLKKTPPVAIQPTITPLYSSVPTPTPIPTTASKKLCAQSGDEQASCFSSYLSQNPIPDDIAKSDDKL